jgi:hypothetical protein
MKVNYYPTVKDTVPTAQPEIFKIYDYIRNDPKLKTATEAIQNDHRDGILDGFTAIEKQPYRDAKNAMLPCVIFSGCYERDTKIPVEQQGEVEHTGRMNVDIDLNSPSELDSFFQLVSDFNIPFIEAAARSVSGALNGSLWANVLIEIIPYSETSEFLRNKLKLTEENTTSKLHSSFFDMFANLLDKDAGIKSGSTRDIKRMRFLAHDADIFVNVDAQPLTVPQLEVWLQNQSKQQKKYDTEYQHAAKGISDPFRIALKFAENKTNSKLMPGNQHTFISFFAACLNRMGVEESECLNYVESTLGVQVNSNCVSFPYRAYSANFGSWKDWESRAAPSDTIPEMPSPSKPETKTTYFRALGYNKDETGSQRFYYYSFLSNSIISMTPSKMSKANLFQLAPMMYWETHFPTKSGFDINSAADFLISIGIQAGFFDPMKLRGRGAWLDNGSVLIHTGDSLIIDGKKNALGSVDTQYIYERGVPLNLSADNPMSAGEASKILKVVQKLNWSRGDLEAQLLMGWLALVPICGGLSWRPHIWITTSFGGGKTWVNNNILNRMVGVCAYKLEGGSTEAGIRELIGNDALAVIMDEAEGQTQRAQQTIENILGLARSASSSKNVLAKGTGGKGANVYRPNYMFAFSSIVPQTDQGADKRRVSILQLGKPIPKDEFEIIENEYNSFMTDDYVKRFQSRMINLMPQVLESIQVFRKAIARKTGRSDMGDQLGSMFGGAWHIEFDAPATMEQAEFLVSTFDFDGEQSMDATPDELQCMQHILSSQLRISDKMLTVSELIDFANGGFDVSEFITAKECDSILKRHGIKIGIGVVWFSNTSVWIKSVLAKTQWAKDHKSVLQRIEGATYSKQEYFINKISQPAVSVPLDKII